jgi:sugar/nucleoside kinase (ribokinase family)
MLLGVLGDETGPAGVVAAWARALGAAARTVTAAAVGEVEVTALHVPGSSLVGPPLGEGARQGAAVARRSGARLSVELPAWRDLREAGPLAVRALLDELEPDVLLATPAEWQILGGAYLAAPLAVLRRGIASCTVFTADARLELEGPPCDPLDPTGAAEAFAGGFLLGGSLEEAGRRALAAAARCAATSGPLPPAV